MATPPAGPERPDAFAKHPPKKAPAARSTRRHDDHSVYSDEEFRRGFWLIAAAMAALVALGIGLIFSGLI
jgi:hypothetical protein